MKFALSTSFSFVLLLFCAAPTFAQTSVEGSYPVDFISDINDVYVDASGLGYLGGTCGVLRKTTDFGTTWTVEDSPTDNDIESLACPPGGCGTRLLATDDQLFRLARNRWTEVTYANYEEGGELHWLTDELVIHDAGNNSLFRSTDGGLTWTAVEYGAIKDSNLSFPDNQSGYLVADEKVLRTTDGGASFAETGYVHPASVFHINFLNENDGWLWDREQQFYRTSDGGVSWMLLNADVQITSLRWFTALSATRLVANQGITMAESNDGGVTWTRGQYGIQSVRSVGDKYHRQGEAFYLPGAQNQLLYSASNFMDFVRQDDYERPQTTISNIAFSSNTVGYAIAGVDFLVTTDQGDTWTEKPLGRVSRSLTIINGNPVVLYDSETQTSSDQGDTFTDFFPAGVVVDGDYPDQAVTKPNGDIYFMARYYAYLSTDGGQTFTSFQHNSDVFVNALFFLDENNGYLLDRNRQYLFTTDGGITWDPGASFPGFSPSTIFFTSEETGFGGSPSGLYETSDRGTTWTQVVRIGHYALQNHPTDESIIGLRAAGTGNEVIRSKDGGTTWSALAGNCFFPQAGAFTPDGKFFFATGGGFIVRHDLEELISSTPRRDLPAALALKAFPNPTNELVNVELPSSITSSTINVYDGNGRMLKQQQVAPGLSQTSVSLHGLPQGVYLLRWMTEDGRSGRVRVVKGR